MWEGWPFLDRSPHSSHTASFSNSPSVFNTVLIIYLIIPQRLLLLHHPDDHWFRRLDSRPKDGGWGEEDCSLLALPPLWHRHDCHELQPCSGGGHHHHYHLHHHIKADKLQVINSVKSVGKMLGILKDPEEDEEY